MASIGEALVAAVTADGAVAALIGTRFFPVGARQGASYPYATWQVISTQGAAHLDGPSNLDWPRVQINAWADTAMAALALAEAVRAAIDGIPSTAAGLSFVATLQDQRGPAPDEETRKFGVSQDYFLWHERT